MPPKRAPFLPLKPCQYCGELMPYQRYFTCNQNKTETNRDYEKRKFCNLSCANAFNNNRLGTKNVSNIWNHRY